MSPDLPEKLLGMSIDDPSDSRSHDDDSGEPEELERFVFLAIGGQRLAVHVDEIKTITNPPAELTRVPRAPEAVEGVVDFRGEITAVIEPRTHFPVDGEPAARQRLIVFDRPTDRQPAAIRVDDVIGVENVLASNVLEESDVEDVDGSAFEHPLVVALVKQERAIERGSSVDPSSDEGQQSAASLELEQSALESNLETEAGTGSRSEPTNSSPGAGGRSSEQPLNTSLAAARTQTSEEFDAAGDDAVGARSRTQASESASEAESRPEPARKLVTEATPVVDVERFLLASGYQK